MLDEQRRGGAEQTLFAQYSNRQLLPVMQGEPTLPPAPGISEAEPFKHFVFESPTIPK